MGAVEAGEEEDFLLHVGLPAFEVFLRRDAGPPHTTRQCATTLQPSPALGGMSGGTLRLLPGGHMVMVGVAESEDGDPPWLGSTTTQVPPPSPLYAQARRMQR